MPRRSSNKGDSPVPRRQSARIAAASAGKTPTPSPIKKTRRTSKRDSVSHVESAEARVEQNGTEGSHKDTSCPEEPVEKKQKLGETTEVAGEPSADSRKTSGDDDLSPKVKSPSESDSQAAKEAGFELVEKSSVPQPESEEVKTAICAQGEDGQLLVDYVQVSKDDLPAQIPENTVVTSGDKPSNGADAKDICKGDMAVDLGDGEQSVAAGLEQNDEAPVNKTSSPEGIPQ